MSNKFPFGSVFVTDTGVAWDANTNPGLESRAQLFVPAVHGVQPFGWVKPDGAEMRFVSSFPEGGDQFPWLPVYRQPPTDCRHTSIMIEAANLFREYEAVHQAKGPGHEFKAQRNAEMAKRIELMLERDAAPKQTFDEFVATRYSRVSVEGGPLPQFWACLKSTAGTPGWSWFDSAAGYEIALHWVAYAEAEFEFEMAEEQGFYTETAMKLGYLIVRSDDLERLWQAGLIV